MAKRFTDNAKWNDAWFMDLPSKYKLFWIFVLDNCNHAGIWEVNFKMASFFIGEHLEQSECKRVFKDRVDYISDGYWYILKFVEFQQNKKINDLNPKNKCHKSIIDKLLKHNIIEPIQLAPCKPLDRGYSNSNSNSNSTIDEIYKKFIDEVKAGGFATRIEAIYMRLRIREGSLTDLLKDFKLHIIEENRLHKNTNDFFTNFKNWLNVQDRIGNLNKYKK